MLRKTSKGIQRFLLEETFLFLQVPLSADSSGDTLNQYCLDYSGTSLVEKHPPFGHSSLCVGPCGGLWGWEVSFERGTPVANGVPALI